MCAAATTQVLIARSVGINQSTALCNKCFCKISLPLFFLANSEFGEDGHELGVVM